MKKLTLIAFLAVLSGCKELYTLTYKTKCSQGHTAYYFSNKKGEEITVIDSCNLYDYGKKVSIDWIKKQNK